jgi:hypothetical protein
MRSGVHQAYTPEHNPGRAREQDAFTITPDSSALCAPAVASQRDSHPRARLIIVRSLVRIEPE